MATMRTIAANVAGIGGMPGDDHDTALQKSLLVLSTLMMATLAIVWGGIYWLFDEPLAASIPLGYALVSFLSVTLFAVLKRYRLFRFSQLALSLFLPFFLMMALGGFINSSGVVLWSLTSPLGALLFANKRHALVWFMAFLCLVVLGAVVESSSATVGTNLDPFMIQFFFVMNIGLCSTVIFVLTRYFVVGEATALQQVEVERSKSDNLLANILPTAIAERLLAFDRPIADKLENVTILFADIVGFTKYANSHSPEHVVTLLDDVFSEFDDLADRHGLEKIKTVGDLYMVAGGLPDPRPDHAVAVADFAIEVQAYLAMKRNEPAFDLEIRIGIHSGSVVAGVIGKRKFSYDIWGDSVNLAARLESASSPGRILVSRTTRELIAETHDLERQGVVDVKGIGPQETFLLRSRKPANR